MRVHFLWYLATIIAFCGGTFFSELRHSPDWNDAWYFLCGLMFAGLILPALILPDIARRRAAEVEIKSSVS